MDRRYERHLAGLINSGERGVLLDGLKGVEKESLRVTPEGRVSQRPHPRALGSALTHEHVTTDYSEALIELVTPTFTTSWELLQYLTDLHQFIYRQLDDELLWCTSMPCRLDGDASIPIAQYGRSNVGRMKTVYRHGLGLRYGRIMQAISGVHFNYSFPPAFWPVLADVLGVRDAGQGFVSDTYFGLLRNYRRHGWIVHYLFGVSPAVCRSFVAGRSDHGLDDLGRGTLYGPYATSLRMSDLGYRNKSQAGVTISVNSLDGYVRDLSEAITTPYPEYQRLGVEVDGEWRQLNANRLQIENEYYAFIRPKRVARSGERPTKALKRAGVEYVEMRSLDVSALDPVGVNQNKLRFLEAFAAFCALAPSPPLEPAEQLALDRNHVTVARRGREPGLALRFDGRDADMRTWAREILDAMQGACELLDHGDASRPYATALAVQTQKLADVEATPSARLLKEMRDSGESFFDIALRMSRTYKAYFTELHPPNEARTAEFAAEAEASLEAQARLEAAPQPPFREYLAGYFAD
ncbi:MAG: glutamate--cysteine ligase [Proteobacteria bacterium]|nr:glutamate--cysteine ligase [Pseudomonadota bacterium]